MPEIDSRAAESAITSGVPIGSAFAANNRLRLRDSERISRLALGQQLLQPYLQRQSAASMQSQALAAEAARQAAGDQAAYQRLIASEGGATSRAQLGESSAMQRALLSEGGATARQRAEIEAQSKNLALTLAQRREEAYLPFAQQQYFARLARTPFNPSRPNGDVWQAGVAPSYGGGPTAAPAAARGKSTGATLAMVDRILAQYGIGNETGRPYDATPPATMPTMPKGEFNWMGDTSPENAALQDYYNTAGPSGEYNWTAAVNPDVATMQKYYE